MTNKRMAEIIRAQMWEFAERYTEEPSERMWVAFNVLLHLAIDTRVLDAGAYLFLGK